MKELRQALPCVRISLLAAFLTMGAVLGVASADEIGDAVSKRDGAKIRQLLAAKPSLAYWKSADGSCLLHMAAQWNDAALAAALLKSGLDADSRNDAGYAPLHVAARVNAAAVARLLLQAGAARDGKTGAGLIPLDIAISADSGDVVRVLLSPAPREEESAPRAAPALVAEPAPRAPATVSRPAPGRLTADDGEAALLAGRLDRAREIFTALLVDEPANERINFLYGLTCLSMNDYSRARLAFERVLDVNPGHDRARVELAQTHALLKEFELATREFQTVLSHNPPRAVRENIESFMKKMKATSSPWPLSGRVDAGGFFDDNVNAGPESQIISISPIAIGSESISELTLGEESKPADGMGVFVSTALSAAYDVGEPGDWLMAADCFAYMGFINDMSDHDSLYCQASAGPRKSDDRNMVQIPLKAAHIASGHDPLLTLYGIAPVYAFVTGSEGQCQWITALSVELRDYAKLDDRDGVFYSASETLRYALARGRHSVFAGFAVMRDDTDAGIYRYNGWALSGGASVKAHEKAVLYAQARLAGSDYAEKETLAPELRRDTLWQLLAGINSPLTDTLSLDISYQNTSNGSTFDLYEYSRNVATVSARYSF